MSSEPRDPVALEGSLTADPALLERYLEVRQLTEALAAPLSA